MIRFLEALEFVHTRRPDESAVQRIRPCMVRALERFVKATTRFLAQARASVTAYVKERADLAGLVAENDHAFTDDVLQEVFAGFGDLALVARAEPLGGEDTFLFAGENISGDEVSLRERSGAKGAGFHGRAGLMHFSATMGKCVTAVK